MNESLLEEGVRDFYENEQLPEDLVNAIVHTSTFAESAQRWKRRAVVALLSLAGMMLVAGGLYFELSRRKAETQNATAAESMQRAHAAEANAAEAIATERARASRDANLENGFRLVAFRSHGDACPHCRATGEVFLQIAMDLEAMDLEDEPIAAEEFDLSRSNEREAVDARIAELKIGPLIEGRNETAFLAVVDANGKRIKEFKPSMGSSRISEAVRKLVQSPAGIKVPSIDR